MEIDKKILLEQYKIFVQTAENVSDRRASANKYFLSINSILLGGLGYLIVIKVEFWYLILSILGLILSCYWVLTLKSYRTLNSAKFSVINKIEKSLPVKPFSDEWEIIGRGKSPNKYLRLSVLEQCVPVIFSLLYIILFIFNFIRLI